MRLRIDQLKSYKKPAVIELSEKTCIRFLASSKDGITVNVADSDGEILPLFHLPSGLQQRAIVVSDCTLISFEAKEFSLAYETWDLKKGEDQNFDPPPAPAPADNLLAQIREKVRREMGVTREGFLVQNDTGYPGYELDDDEPELFEEELEARQKQKEKEAAAKAATETPEAPQEPKEKNSGEQNENNEKKE